MVQIPEFKAKTGLTSQTGTRARPVPDITAAAAAPFEAAAELAGDVQKVSTRFYEAQKSLQRKTEATKLLDQYLKGDENTSGLNQLSFDAQNNPNTNTALQDFQTGNENLIKNISNGVKDPVVKQIFTSRANEVYNNEYLGVQSAVWKNVREDGVKTLNKNIEFYTNQIINAGGNKAKENSSWLGIEKLIEDGNMDGLGLPNDFYETVKSKINLLKAEKLAFENPDVFLKNNENGYYNDKIDPENLLTITKIAVNAQTKNYNKFVSEVKSEASSISKGITDFSDIGEYFNITTWDNLYLSALENDALQKSLGLPGMEDEIQELLIYKNNFEVLDKAKASTPDQVKEALDKTRLDNTRLSKDPKADPFEQKALKSLEDSLSDLHSKMISEIGNDLLNMAEDLDPERKIAELDFFEKDTQTFYMASQDRNKQAKEVADFYNVPLQLLKKEEREFIKDRLLNGTIEEKETLLINLAIIGGENLKDVFVNLSMEKNAAIYTHVGLLMYNNNGMPTETTRSILNGIEASKSERYKDLDVVVKEKIIVEDFAQIAIDYSPPATSNNLKNLNAQIAQAADMIFADKLYRNENNLIASSDSIYEAYEESIQMASGLTKKGTEYYGGWQNFGEGNKILLPQNMVNAQPFERIDVDSKYPTVKEMIEEGLTPELLEKALTYDYNIYDSATGKTVTETKTVLPFLEEEGVLNPQDLFENIGNNILFDDDGKLMEDVFLETAHDGMYYVGMGNNNDGTGEYFRDEDGNEILFNLKRIVPDLLLKLNE